MKKSIVFLAMFSLFLSPVYADGWLDRFDFSFREPTETYSASSIELPEQEDFEEASVEDYNSAVEYNNKAIEAMNSNDLDRAIELFENAISLSPATIGFRKNYLIALNKAKDTDKLIFQSLKVLGQNPSDHQTAYLIGVSYLNDIKDYKKAADFFSYALSYKADEPHYVSALITALDNLRKYNDNVLELLKKYTPILNDSYQYYRLGLKYLDLGNYKNSIKAFSQAKTLDTEGFSHHAFVRAAFYSGNLRGLEEIARKTIKSFPKDANINSTKRIYNSLKKIDYAFKEKIKLIIQGASSLENLHFTVRPITNFSNHQETILISAKLSSKNKTINANINTKNNGTMDIEVPKNMWSTEILLELNYHIKTKALLGFYLNDENLVNIDEYRKDPNLSLEDERIGQLCNYIDSLTLEDSDNYNTPEELFVAKAVTAIAKGLEYQENGIDESVSWALDNLDKCDCTEFSRLLSALCLRKGIPSRLVSGFLVKSELLGKDTPIGHEWCEFYVKGMGWTSVDPTLQTSMHRAYFRNLLNDQIFFEYPQKYNEGTRIGVHYTANSSDNKSDVKVDIKNSYNISYWK